ncbi:MAG: IS30 family transposase [Paludibacter sp.]|nr:IS30 family transposase [Paludibacter sp.]
MKHITEVQRYEIFAYLESNKSNVFIAKKLNLSKGTISREIARNSDKRNGNYKPALAQRKANERKEKKHKAVRFTERMMTMAKNMLRYEQYSPEQIVGNCNKLNIPMVSHERLYQWIWDDKKCNGELHTHLRRKGRKYRKRGNSKDTRGIITGRVDISMRPAIVEQKERFGDLELDTVIGKNHKGALLTMNDRATGLLWIRKLAGKNAEPLTEKAIEALTPHKCLIHTATADNGKEFAFHQKIADSLEISVYFAKPYHSWERGANENTNGLIRQYFPKGTDFELISEQDVKEVQDKLNNRPRKRLDFLSPNQKFFEITGTFG